MPGGRNDSPAQRREKARGVPARRGGAAHEREAGLALRPAADERPPSTRRSRRSALGLRATAGEAALVAPARICAGACSVPVSVEDPCPAFLRGARRVRAPAVPDRPGRARAGAPPLGLPPFVRRHRRRPRRRCPDRRGRPRRDRPRRDRPGGRDVARGRDRPRRTVLVCRPAARRDAHRLRAGLRPPECRPHTLPPRHSPRRGDGRPPAGRGDGRPRRPEPRRRTARRRLSHGHRLPRSACVLAACAASPSAIEPPAAGSAPAEPAAAPSLAVTEAGTRLVSSVVGAGDARRLVVTRPDGAVARASRPPPEATPTPWRASTPRSSARQPAGHSRSPTAERCGFGPAEPPAGGRRSFRHSRSDPRCVFCCFPS